MDRSDHWSDELFEEGDQMRRQVAGDQYVDAAVADESEMGRDFQRFVTEYAWAVCWANDGLDPKYRSLITVAMMAAAGREKELRIHLRGAIANGATPVEIRETIMHVAIYAGVPAAVEAMSLAREIVSVPGYDDQRSEPRDGRA